MPDVLLYSTAVLLVPCGRAAVLSVQRLDKPWISLRSVPHPSSRQRENLSGQQNRSEDWCLHPLQQVTTAALLSCTWVASGRAPHRDPRSHLMALKEGLRRSRRYQSRAQKPAHPMGCVCWLPLLAAPSFAGHPLTFPSVCIWSCYECPYLCLYM